jgi:DNA helicase IV
VNNPGKEIGILCSSDRLRKQVFNSLAARLKDKGVVVQTYAYADQAKHPAKSLKFDVPNVLTVLNFQSAKGLEFDAVFILDPFAAYQLGGAGDQAFKMQMYVMCSRAREYLDLILRAPGVTTLLPPRALYESQDIG